MNVKSPIAHLVPGLISMRPRQLQTANTLGTIHWLCCFGPSFASKRGIPQNGRFMWTGKWSGIWMCLGLLILRQTTPPCLSGEFADCAVNPFVRTPFGNVMPMQRTLFCIFLRETWVIFMFWMTQLAAHTAHRQMHHVYILQVSFCLMVSAL